MATNKQTLQNEIKELEDLMKDADIPQATKDAIKKPLENAREQLANLLAAEKEKAVAKTPVEKKAATKKVATAKVKANIAKNSLRALVKSKPALKKAYGNASETNLEKDAQRKAMPSGKRKAGPDAKRPFYYETRSNRSDVSKKAPYLEKGGIITHAGNKFTINDKGVVKEVRNFYTKKLVKEVEINGKKYRRNVVFKTYNSLDKEEILREQDVPKIHEKGGRLNYIGDKVYLGFYKNKFTVVDYKLREPFAREYFKTKQEAIDFCDENKLNLISAEVVKWNKEWADKSIIDGSGTIPKFDLPEGIEAIFEKGGTVNDAFESFIKTDHGARLVDVYGKNLIKESFDKGYQDKLNNKPADDIIHEHNYEGIAYSAGYRCNSTKNTFAKGGKTASKKVYNVTFYDVDDEPIDDTQIDEQNEDLAWQLFEEFGHTKEPGMYLEFEEVEAEKFAAGGYVVGRTYLGNDGKQYRFVGDKGNNKGLFMHGREYVPMNYDDLTLSRPGLFAKGGRLKSAINRDRKYTSQQEWEKNLVRKTPVMKYNEGHYEQGGQIGMNIDVFGYPTKHFNKMPYKGGDFEKAIETINRIDGGAYFTEQSSNLRRLAEEIDACVEAKDMQQLFRHLQMVGIYNFKSGMRVNTEHLNEFLADMAFFDDEYIPADMYDELKVELDNEEAQQAQAREANKANIEAIANKFSELLHEDLSDEDFAEINRLNKTPEYIENGYCAVHDFVDGNEYLAQAFKEVMGYDLDFVNPETGKQNVQDIHIANEAIKLAKENAYKVSEDASLNRKGEKIEVTIIEEDDNEWYLAMPESLVILHPDAFDSKEEATKYAKESGFIVVENKEFKKGGKIKSQSEFNKLVAEKTNMVNKLSPQEMADLWNKNTGSVADKWTKEDAEKSHNKKYLIGLLVEKELTEEEYNKYFEKGGKLSSKKTTKKQSVAAIKN